MVYRIERLTCPLPCPAALLFKNSQNECFHLTPFFSYVSALPCTTETHLTLFASSACAQLSSQRRGGVLLPTFKPSNVQRSDVLLQICPFIFKRLQDAPPASLFFSCFCIVAGGVGTSPLSGVKVLLEASIRRRMRVLGERSEPRDLSARWEKQIPHRRWQCDRVRDDKCAGGASPAPTQRRAQPGVAVLPSQAEAASVRSLTSFSGLVAS